VSENFNAKENWIPPFLSNLTDEPKLKVKLADKSLADCIEALIGVYLIHLGVNGAKSFIQWLDFTISDAEGKSNFLNKKIELPSPLLIKFDSKFESKLENKYAMFEEQIGSLNGVKNDPSFFLFSDTP
jgi:dsRNA-specific ribonuclease